MLYLFDKNNGSLIDSVSTGQSLFPDLAYDGQWLYGCAATYFTQIDPADGEQTELFPTAQLGGDLPLGLTYLDDSDTFLTTSFSHDPIIEFSRTGEVIRTFWLGLPQITGLAYDTENGGSYLWVFAQDGPLQLSIYQADISFPGQEQLTGFAYHVPSLPSMTVMNSRGAALSGAWTPAAPVLACVIEGEPADRLLAFEMDVAPPWVTFSPEEGTLPPPPEENQVTVTVAVDGAQIAEPGIYEGQIRITSNDGDENPLDVPLTINVHGGNSIFGHVTGAGTGPLAGAEITVVEAALSTFSSEGGGYIITSIPTGEDYHVTCAAPGYRTATAYPVAVVPEEAVELDFDLELDLSPTPGPTFPPSPTAPPSTPTIPPTATASPTPPPTLPPTETATPTHEATNTATPSVTPEPPSPTATSPAATSTPIPSPTAGCDRFGVDLTLATGRVSPGEEFWCQADICSPAGPWNNAPFVALLDIGAADYWFFPHWRQYPPDFDYLLLDIPHGLMQLWVLEPFAWPDTGDSSFQPIWIHGALLTEDMSSIAGEMDTVTFGYGP